MARLVTHRAPSRLFLAVSAPLCACPVSREYRNTRNPYDCCVSYYYHTKGLPEYRFQDGTFDEFFDMFLEGHVDFGHYFEHVLSWYERRFDHNVLFATYEDLKKDTAGWIMRIADFIGEEYSFMCHGCPKKLS
ncbi:hypothetical protein HPB52_013431 [Rhipicephalus sanguineus]|uniref:Sulfotransferase domain-containing protein n=1 Tax=Rhipicephalus sanguineus TaxID=34632 RepID=A0A9D4QB05_RHISA|nr:hypothetical protein HPB52_013431 [Rhipicephalus sanguineus]